MHSIFSKDLHLKIADLLSPVYSKDERETLAFHLLENIFGSSRTDLLLNSAINISEEKNDSLNLIIDRLLRNEPIQHIFGEADFYGRKFKVNEHVLVPRQETEELIQLIVKKNTLTTPKILDIGTGSGCIACSLALEIRNSEVHALDISDLALDTASQNSNALEANVTFLKCNILNEEIPESAFDIIVSNPPYVLDSEKKQMHQNVTDFDPHLALFVSDEDPLIFYRVVAEKSKKALNTNGKLYFEINEKFGSEVKTMLHDFGYSDVYIYKDLNGKDRFVSGICS
ncbi:peptide chain release factor N(5)-glutamine methyltransferase [Reichenbachiella sp. MALMAid0571]|uniref:peptide chain release factor N(5)-glutamine methyltransferase n=1 Tax=Reichenbachiella sp. MALMAid0571 TaxID=3143939 RepID=UPI0032DF93AB